VLHQETTFAAPFLSSPSHLWEDGFSAEKLAFVFRNNSCDSSYSLHTPWYSP
jgi:hypothetical protein